MTPAAATRLAAAALLAAATLLAGLLSAGSASASTSTAGAWRSSVITAARVTRATPVSRGSRYLALGDSVAFGYQEPKVSPPPDYTRPATFRGYPEQTGAALHLKVTNLACPGETSASLINVSAPTLACENAYRKAYPLHVRYSGSQLTYAVAFLRRHPGVKLVSLMIGANDLFRCQARTADGCRSQAEQRAVLTQISANVRRILKEIRHRAGYRGQLAIVNYYSLNYASPLVNGYSRKLNRAMDDAARPFGVVIADGYGKLRTASVRFGEQPCLAGLLTQLGTAGTCGVHPSYAGQALLAQALIKAIRL